MPALNDLLRPYGIAFGDAVLEGQAALDGEQIYYASGANIVRFPAGGYLHAQNLADKAAAGERKPVQSECITCNQYMTNPFSKDIESARKERALSCSAAGSCLFGNWMQHTMMADFCR